MIDDKSTDLIRGLCSPGILNSSGQIEIVETHISYVLLAGEFAYKIKKPVNLGFVDFSSLEKRKFFCNEELRLNQRFAPDIYLEVTRITGSIKQPQINGHGPCIEFAVKMKQFPSHQEILKIINDGMPDSESFEQLIVNLVNFHDQALVADVDSRFGSIDTIRSQTMDNFKAITSKIHDPIIGHRIQSLKHWVLQSLTTHSSEFADRKEAGRIRECHGDLHLGNLVLIDDQIVLFDCLEFNEALRWIDVASELAFLLMDLRAHDCDEIARRVLNQYLEASGDYGILTVLQHYLVYRTMVRAKVACIQNTHKQKIASVTTDFARYFDLAEKIINQHDCKQLIITHGLSGSGKTWVSDRLLEKTDIIRIRSDVARKKLFKVEVTAPSSSELNAGIYTEIANQQVYDRLAETAMIILDAGYTVIVDATFLKEDDRRIFKNIAMDRNIPFRILHLDAPSSVLSSRITNRQRRMNDASEANIAVLKNQLNTIENLNDEEKHHTITINTAVPFSMHLAQSILSSWKC